VDVLLGLLAVDELYDMIVLETFHDGYFALEILEEFGGEFGAND
jgi:hypothetical protein